MKPLGCAPYPQTRRHPKTADGADASHLCTSKRYDPKADELLLGTDAVDVVVKATVARAGQIATATENSIAEPAPSTAETSAGSCGSDLILPPANGIKLVAQIPCTVGFAHSLGAAWKKDVFPRRHKVHELRPSFKRCNC